MADQPDYSRDALARFIDFVVDKNLVHPATAQGWRVATTKVLEELPPDGQADIRRVDVEGTFRAFLNRNPGRLSPASVGEYRRRVGRAIEEFVRWMDDPGSYAFKGALRAPRAESRRRPDPARAGHRPGAGAGPQGAGAGPHFPAEPSGPAEEIALHYPLRPELLAQVVVPRDLTVEEARRMGAFLVTLAVDFRPAPAGEA
jgi:hypothetical protein